jgi:phosphoribosylformylglycinamidine (FGAM) synthase-like enzyme
LILIGGVDASEKNATSESKMMVLGRVQRGDANASDMIIDVHSSYMEQNTYHYYFISNDFNI